MKKEHLFLAPLLAAVAAVAPAHAAPMAIVPAAATASVEFEIYLPLRNTAALDALLEAQQTAGSPSYHKWLTPAQFAKQFGPTADTIAAAKSAIQAAGMSVIKVSARSVRVSGNVGGANKLLGISIGTTREASSGTSRMVAATRPVMVPALQALGAKVVAFAPLPAHRPFVTRASLKAVPDSREGTDGGYWFTDLKQAYDYPSYSSKVNGTRLDGTGVHVAALMSDLLYPNDVQSFFDHEKFTKKGGDAVPVVTTVLVNGGGTTGGNGSVEASLDVQMETGGAPGANVSLYSIPNLSDDNITDGYNQIVNENVQDIVSSSFGECELYYTAAYNGGTDFTDILDNYEEIFKQGNSQGQTFLASSGDNGGLECLPLKYFSGKDVTWSKGVSTPAASDYVTAVGGGNLVTAYKKKSLDSSYVSENGQGDPLIPYDPYGTGGMASGGYWGAGGGISTIFKQPKSQAKTKTASKFRTLPDVGMHVGGCPGGISQTPCGPDRSYVFTYYNKQLYGLIGTSVSSPEFAGALALYVQKNGRMGNANTYLYSQGVAQTKAGGISAPAAQQYYHRNIPGFDGAYSDTDPSVNYNYIVGNGTPDVRLLLGMSDLAPAGIPQTSSNP